MMTGKKVENQSKMRRHPIMWIMYNIVPLEKKHNCNVARQKIVPISIPFTNNYVDLD